MLKRLIAMDLGLKMGATVAPFLCLLLLVGCGGSSPHSNFVSPPPPGPPTISAISAKSGLVGWLVTISGSNFGTAQGSSTVTFNGTAATVANWGDAAVVAKVPTGATSGKVVVTVGGTASNGINFNVITTLPSGSITPTAFGFQCSANQNACPNYTWPNSIAQPGTLRLWDSGTDWNQIESTTKGVYDFTALDGWLDTIYAQNQSNAWNTPINVILTFGFVSCLEASSTAGASPSGKGCIYPPTDFTGTLAGSASFNAFVTALVTHCNPNNRCVKDLIKNYEMWNEPNVQLFWHDTSPTGELEIYQMVYPAVAIIRANVPNAVIMTMASTVDAQYTATWLQYELTYPPASGGTLSDVVVWHQYMNHLVNGQPVENAPEDPATLNAFAGMLSAKNTNPNPATPWPWASKPWAITETGFQAYNPPYSCDTSIFSTSVTTNDCIGQMVRWQLIVLSNGAQSQDWYTWNVNIGSQPSYAAAWYFMMQSMVGASFTTPCTPGTDGVTWTCPFTEADGTTKAQWVWTTNSSGGSYTVPSGFVDSVSLDLTSLATPTATISAGQSINISTIPILLEQ